MNLYHCANCATYWANTNPPDLCLATNRLCPACIAQLPATNEKWQHTKGTAA